MNTSLTQTKLGFVHYFAGFLFSFLYILLFILHNLSISDEICHFSLETIHSTSLLVKVESRIAVMKKICMDTKHCLNPVGFSK